MTNEVAILPMPLTSLSTMPLEMGDDMLPGMDFSNIIKFPPDIAGAIRRKDFNQALVWLRDAHKHEPWQVDHITNIGMCLRNLDRAEESLEYFERSIELNKKRIPYDAKRVAVVLANLSASLSELSRLEEAEAAAIKSFMTFPNPLAQWCLTLLRLRMGNLEHGWPLFARRTEIPMYSALSPYTVPEWDGVSPVENLLLTGEQGMGERIMYSAVFQELAEKCGAKVYIELTKEVDRLAPLFRRSFPKLNVIVEDQIMPIEGTQQFRMGDAMRIMRPTFAQFKPHNGYLKADIEKRQKFLDALPGDGPIIGISWQSKNEEFGHYKGIKLEELMPLFKIPGARVVSLQYGLTTLEFDIEHFCKTHGVTIHRPLLPMEMFRNIDATAALMSACDHVVTVSNINAHLAGALGVPVSLLLREKSRAQIWCWFTKRTDSPWYPSMRIYRSGDRDLKDAIVLVASNLGGLNGCVTDRSA